MRPTTKRLSLAGTGLALTMTLTACGSDEGGTVQQNSDVEFTGDPVKVMTLAPVDTAAINTPEIITAAEAAVATLNNAGGLGGHEVELIACNDGNDPNTAGECARKAVSEGVVAVVGGFTTNGTSIVPVIEKAGIPWIGGPGLAAEELSSKVSYPLIAGAVGFTGMGARTVEDKCESTALVLYDVPTAEKAVGLINAGIVGAKGKPAKHIKVPTTTTNFSAVAKSAGESDCAIIGLPNDQVAALAAAGAAQGEDTRYYAVQGALNKKVLEGAGGALDGAVSAVNFVPANDPAWNEAKKASEDVDWTYPYAQNTWAAYQVLAEVVGESTDVTPESVMAALQKANNVTAGGLTAPIDFTKEFPVPGLNRVFNPNMMFVKAKGDDIVKASAFQDITPLFGG